MLFFVEFVKSRQVQKLKDKEVFTRGGADVVGAALNLIWSDIQSERIVETYDRSSRCRGPAHRVREGPKR